MIKKVSMHEDMIHMNVYRMVTVPVSAESKEWRRNSLTYDLHQRLDIAMETCIHACMKKVKNSASFT